MSAGAFVDFRRKTIRAQTNPMDKCTIVSIFPKHIVEYKCTIQPGRFEIKPGTYANPSLLVVGSSSWWREIDDEQPLVEVTNSSIQVADSVVKDYCNGLLACNMEDAMPGLFYVMGEYDLVSLKMKHKNLIENANANQNRWYMALVKITDALWARTDGSPLCVSDDARLAARELNLTSKDWMKDFTAIEKVRCMACGALKDPQYPVCRECKAISDPVRAVELGLEFAK